MKELRLLRNVAWSWRTKVCTKCWLKRCAKRNHVRNQEVNGRLYKYVFFGNWFWRCELCLNWHPVTCLDRPLGLQEVEASRISNTVCTWRWQVVSPIHRLPLPPRRYSWYSFLLRGWDDRRAKVWLEGLRQWKIPSTVPQPTVLPCTPWDRVQ